MNYMNILRNFLFVNNSILSYLFFIYLFIYLFFLCPQLVVKTKCIDTLIKLLPYLLAYLLTSYKGKSTFSWEFECYKVTLAGNL